MMSDARQDLLDRVLVHVAERGIGELSLRQLAAAIGTSHRMLIYHFGSHEGLVTAVVAAVESQQRELMQQFAGSVATPTELIRAVWRQVADPDIRPFVRLFFEVLAAAMQQRPGTEGFLDSLTTAWLAGGEQAAAQLGVQASPADLRLGVAVIRGLLIDVVATDSERDASLALDRFVDLWQRAQPVPPPPQSRA